MAKIKVKVPDRVLLPGLPNLERCDNKVVSARYTAITFFPVVRCLLLHDVVVVDDSYLYIATKDLSSLVQVKA